MRYALAALLLLLLLLPTAALADVAPEGEWVATGSPSGPAGPAGTLATFQDGTIRLVGPMVQLYHPNTGAWTPAGSLHGGGGVVTLLTNGTVLVTGLSAAEVYDPSTETSQLSGAMKIPRTGHQATLLASGDVLVSGGMDASNQLVGPAEIYAPANGTWTLVGVLNHFRAGHAAALLPTGKVLVAGGGNAPLSSELYDPSAGIWTLAPNMAESYEAGTIRAVRLLDGRVLVAGRASPVVPKSQLYDPVANGWSPSMTIGTAAAGRPELVVLRDGRVLSPTPECRIQGCGITTALFDPHSALWAPAPSPLASHAPRMTLLPDGRVLLVHGTPPFTPNARAQLFRPDNGTPRLIVSPSTADFGRSPVGVPVQRTLTIQNTGDAALTGSATAAAPFTTIISGESFTVAPGASATVLIEFTPQDFAVVSGFIEITSNGNSITIPATGAGGIALSGRITDPTGLSVRGILVELHGAVSAGTTTDADGRYVFIVQPNNGYTVTPTDQRATFSPTTRSVLAEAVDIDDLDFVADALTGVSLAAAVLPSSRSVQVGIPATAFATIINLSLAPATECGISKPASIPGTFTYQTTDPGTNQVTGSPNTPVTIPGGGLQTYVVSLSPTAAFSATDVELAFDCSNSEPAPVVSGVNTLLLSASTTPVPDIVAIVATLTNDGIVNVPGVGGTGAFAVATANVGASGSIAVSADTGHALLPVALTLCQTHPTTSACLASPTPTVAVQIAANATPTFSIFVAGTGTGIPFDPANNRVFVRFKDAAEVTRGATSVAVRTAP